MAKGKRNKRKDKKGAISRFLDCLMSCCGRQKRRGKTGKSHENEAYEVKDNSSAHPSRSAELGEDIDGIINLPGCRVPAELVEFRESILKPVKARLDEFEAQLVEYFTSRLAVEMDEISTFTAKRNNRVGVEISDGYYTAMMVVSDEGAITYTQGFWEEEEQAWYTRTFEESYWGMRHVANFFQ